MRFIAIKEFNRNIIEICGLTLMFQESALSFHHLVLRNTLIGGKIM